MALQWQKTFFELQNNRFCGVEKKETIFFGKETRANLITPKMTCKKRYILYKMTCKKESSCGKAAAKETTFR